MDFSSAQIHSFCFYAQTQVDAVIFIPCSFFACNGAAADGTEHILCEHRSVIRQFVFFRNHDDACSLVSFPDSFCRIECCCAAAQYNEFFHGIHAVCYFIQINRHEVFFAYAADRAGFHGCVEDFAANQTSYQTASCAGFLFVFLQQSICETITIFISVHQFVFRGFQTYFEAVYHFQTNLFQSFDDVRHTFPAPAVAAEGTCQFPAVDRREHECCQIPDGFQGFTQNGRCTEEDTISCADFAQHFCLIGCYHIIEFYVDDFVVILNAFCNLFCQLTCVAISAYIRDDNFFTVTYRHFAPFFINIHQFRQMAVQNGTVTGADHVDIHLTYGCQCVCHIGLFEGAQNVVEIIFCCAHITFCIGYCAAQDAFVCIVRTEGVTCHQCFVLYDVGVHGIGPMQVGEHMELQCFIANLQFVAVFDGNAVEITIDDVFQEADGNRCCNHFGSGADVQNPFDAAHMVGFCMVYHDIVNGGNICDLRKCFQIIVEEFFFCCFKQDSLVTCFEQIRVIGSTKFCHHDDVEYTQVLVQNAGPVKIRFELHCFHRCFRLLDDLCLFFHKYSEKKTGRAHARTQFSPLHFLLFILICLDFCFPQTVQVAVFVSSYCLFAFCQCKDCFGSACVIQIFHLAALAGFQIDPCDVVFFQHGMCYFANFYSYFAAFYLNYRNVFFACAIRCVGFQFCHFFAAAYYGNAFVFYHSDDVFTVFADKKSRCLHVTYLLVL